jgi:hypothetical protein
MGQVLEEMFKRIVIISSNATHGKEIFFLESSHT